MLILLLLMYWLGFYLIARSVIDRPAPVFYGMVAVPFLPFTINYSGTLWKDVLVFGSFLLAFALVFFYSVSSKRTPHSLYFAVISLLTVGALARHNSILAAAPLATLMIWPHAPKQPNFFAIIKRLTAGLAIIVLLFMVMNGAIYAALSPLKMHAIGSLFLFDLVGISARVGTVLVPGEWTARETSKIRTRML